MEVTKSQRRLIEMFFFQAEDAIRILIVTEVQPCALPISPICSSADIPSSRGPISSFTFLTASSTPLPRKRFWSPSRSSTASCSPVEAPLGTAARPAAPLDNGTSASTVGLPRLSSSSRAWTEMIVLIVAPTLAGRRARVNAGPEGEDGRPGAVGELLPIVGGQAGRRDGLADAQADRSGAQPESSLGEDLERIVDVHRNERHLG